MNTIVHDVKNILTDESGSSAEHKLQLIANAIDGADSSHNTTGINSGSSHVAAPHEVAILNLELKNSREKIETFQLKINLMTEKMISLEKTLRGKAIIEEHLRTAVMEANADISLHKENISKKDKESIERSEYISILEKRLERNKQESEKVLEELKSKILKQNETIHALEEKCLSQANDSALEIETFRTENFNTSIKLQVFILFKRNVLEF